MRQFIQDKEIDLTQERDLLGTTCYAEELVKAINNIPEGKSCTIGVYAGWGSGKSTIISTAKSMLERREDKHVKVVVYDAWKYANDSFRRMFLLHLQHELRLKETAEMERFYKNVTEEIEPKITVRQKGLGITIMVLALLWGGIGILHAYGVLKDSMSWAALISFASVVIALFNGVFYDLKVSQTKNILFAPEQFEACFCQMMVAVLKKNTGLLKAYHRVSDFVRGDTNSVHDLEKLMIVVDNIDRCNSETAYSLLTDIKTFLCNEAFDVVFVVPVDDGALKKHLVAKSVNSAEIEEKN